MMRRLRQIGIVLSLAVCSLSAQEIPRKAGEWAIQTPEGKQILLSTYRGKVVALAFILTTCPHCQKTTGILSQIQTEWGGRGLQVLESAVQGGAKAAVPGFVQSFHPTFPVGYNEDAQMVLDFCQFTHSRLPMMPIVLLIDRDGMVRFEHDGRDEKFFGDLQEQNFRSELGELLKAPAKKTASKK
jgi:hypothetical protein